MMRQSSSADRIFIKDPSRNAVRELCLHRPNQCFCTRSWRFEVGNSQMLPYQRICKNLSYSSIQLFPTSNLQLLAAVLRVHIVDAGSIEKVFFVLAGSMLLQTGSRLSLTGSMLLDCVIAQFIFIKFLISQFYSTKISGTLRVSARLIRCNGKW